MQLSSALRSGTRPISFKYIRTESLIFVFEDKAVSSSTTPVSASRWLSADNCWLVGSPLASTTLTPSHPQTFELIYPFLPHPTQMGLRFVQINHRIKFDRIIFVLQEALKLLHSVFDPFHFF